MSPFIDMADGAAPLWFLAQTGTSATAPAAPGPPAPDPNAQQSSPFGMVPLLLLFAGIYFLMFAPQMKRNKLHQKLLTELKPGDELVISEQGGSGSTASRLPFFRL